MMNNFIGVYDVLNHELCDSYVEYFKDMEKSNFTQSRGLNNKHKINDSSVFLSGTQEIKLVACTDLNERFLNYFWSKVYGPYKNQYSILEDMPQHGIYSLKLQKTEIGGGYHVWHHENSSVMNSRRLLSFVAYLNDVEEGGETEFLYQSIRVKPKKGTVVLFPGGFTHTHRGNPPLSNEKYIVTGWVEF
jgi:hypothetical protein